VTFGKKMNEISTEPGRQTDAFWGPMSIGFPLFGILIVAVTIGSGVGKGVGGDMAGPFIIGYAILIFYVSTILGFIAACIAAKRNEKRPAMAWIGILINAPPMLIGAFLFLVKIAL